MPALYKPLFSRWRPILQVSLLFVLSLSMTGFLGCKHKTQRNVLIKNVPHTVQQPDFCGEACVSMFLKKFGMNIRQEDIFIRCKVSPMTGRGCISSELYKALKEMGFRPGNAFHSMTPKYKRTSPKKEWKIIYKRLRRGIPTIVCMRYNFKTSYPHFRLVLGFNSERNTVIFHEPNVSGGSYREMKLKRFFKLWTVPDADGDPWLVHMSLELGSLKFKRATRKQFVKARLAQAVIRLNSLEIGGVKKFLEPGVLLAFGPHWKIHIPAFRRRFRVYWNFWKKNLAFALPLRRRTILLSTRESLITALKHKPDERVLDKPPHPPVLFSSTPLARCLPSKLMCGFVASRALPSRWEVLRYWTSLHLDTLPEWLNAALSACPDRPLGKQQQVVTLKSRNFRWLRKAPRQQCKEKRIQTLLIWLTQKKLWKKFVEGWYSRRAQDPLGIQTLNSLYKRQKNKP